MLPGHGHDQPESDDDLRGGDRHDGERENLAVAAAEVVVGLGLIVAIAQKRIDLDVDKLSFLRG